MENCSRDGCMVAFLNGLSITLAGLSILIIQGFDLPLQAACEVCWLQDEAKGDQIAHENAAEEDVGELTTRRSNDWGVVVSEEENKKKIRKFAKIENFTTNVNKFTTNVNKITSKRFLSQKQ